jgi:hypothetical protein
LSQPRKPLGRASPASNETKKLNNNNEYHLITENKIHILIISNLTLDDAGEYTCRIKNDVIHARIQVTCADLNIISQLPPPSINIYQHHMMLNKLKMN